MSPYEKESEAKLTRTTDLEEFYCIANKNIFGYYNNAKIGKIGGGDENITIIQSPRTEGNVEEKNFQAVKIYVNAFYVSYFTLFTLLVWLSGFWTT